MKNGYVYEDKKENYFNFSNDKDEPTLRLDVSYDKNNKIIQYVSKEYGFTDSITSTLEKDPIEIINMHKIFFDESTTSSYRSHPS